MRALPEESLIVVVDEQPNFMKVVHEAGRVVERSKFLLEAAKLLEVPSLATTQNAERMGPLHPDLQPLITGETFDKLAFSCCGSFEFVEAVEQADRAQIVLVGAETHICITQTALDLLEADYEVFLALDAISSRSPESTKIAIKRLRDAGAQVCHTESLVYEWLDTAEHAAFRDVLQVVKSHPLP